MDVPCGFLFLIQSESLLLNGRLYSSDSRAPDTFGLILVIFLLSFFFLPKILFLFYCDYPFSFPTNILKIPVFHQHKKLTSIYTLLPKQLRPLAHFSFPTLPQICLGSHREMPWSLLYPAGGRGQFLLTISGSQEGCGGSVWVQAWRRWHPISSSRDSV